MFQKLAPMFAALLCVSIGAADERPNIVFVMVDDLGYSDLGCFGGEIETPNLDRLAAGGVRFTQFYNESKCVESRSSLLTGWTHHVSKNLQNREVPTLAERLRGEGYRTLMAGKWHLADTPRKRGFDRYFGFLNGAVNFWTGAPTGADKTPQFLLDDDPYTIPETGFYTTDDFTDYAIEFIDEAVTAEPSKPFFLYLAHNAPHYPLHAPEAEIEKYRGRYDSGWDALRSERLERMKRLGLLDKGVSLSARDPLVPSWEDVSPEFKEEYSLLMAVYAAMVDRLDQNIGRLVAALQERGVYENTLIMFSSDNGGCPYQNEEKPDSIPGGPESDRTYNTPWANASNTPYRLYKRYAHEGGTATPFIAHWPGEIQNPGRLSPQVGHLVDILPTCLELAGSPLRQPQEGVSLVSALRGAPFDRERPLFWEYRKHRAVRDGDWKLVAESGFDWSLYNLSLDRIESRDLAATQPQMVERLSREYDQWAARVGAPSHAQCRDAKPMAMPNYVDRLTAQ